MKENELNNVFDEIKPRLINLSLKYQKTIWDAEDAVSETMVLVLEKIDSFKEKSSLKTWIYSICVNKNLEILRKKKTYFEHIKKYFYHNVLNKSSISLGYSLLNEDFQKALESLSEDEKSIFLLSVYEELPQKEIAKIMDISISNVKVKLHRGRKKLLDCLGDYIS